MPDQPEANYVPGSWVAVAAPRGWLLVDLPPEDPVVRRCWKLLSEDAGADSVLDALTSGGIRACRPFALVTTHHHELRIVCRHPAAVVMHLADEADPMRFAGSDGTSWVDRVVAQRLDGFILSAPNPAGTSVELPMGSGVTSAVTVSVSLQARPSDDVVFDSGPRIPTADDEVATSAVPVSQQLIGEVEDSQSAPPDALDDVPTPAAVGEEEPLPEYDYLFVATQHPATRPETTASASTPDAEVVVGDVAGSAPEDGAPQSAEQTAGWFTGAPPARGESGHSADSASDAGDRSGNAGSSPLIEGVPWMEPEPESTPSTSSVAPEADVVDPPVSDATVDRSRLGAATRPTVLAGRCTRGHLSAPYAERCRVCASPMPMTEPFETARPVLGVLHITSGDDITLDRGVLLGRAPELAPGHADERPHVVRLASPEKDISRNHAEVVLDGWNVYVRDLGSVNGTVVTLPGQSPVRLRENELQLLENRAVISLADEVSLTFDVTG